MKVKTSISLSPQVIADIDRATGDGNRSRYIERLLRRHFRDLERAEIGARDKAIYEKYADEFAREAELDLAIQANPWRDQE